MQIVGPAPRQTATGASAPLSQTRRDESRRPAARAMPANASSGSLAPVATDARDTEFERWRNAPSAWLAERLAEAALRDAPPPRERNPLEGAEAIARRLRQNEARLVATEQAINRHADALAVAERRASDAEGKLAETHSLVSEARRCANEAQARLADMQKQLDEARRRAAKAEQRAEAAEATRADIEERAARAFAIMKERIAAAEAEADAAQEALARHREDAHQRLAALEETLAVREDALRRKDAEMQARINDAQRDAQARVFAVQARLDIAEIRLAKAREALEAESLSTVTPVFDQPPVARDTH